MVDPNTGAKAETTEAWKDGLVTVSLREENDSNIIQELAKH